MTVKQIKDFEKCCNRWIEAYCTDNHCKPIDIPIAWAIDTAEMHMENLENELYFDGEDEEEMLDEYNACKQFIKKNKKYIKNKEE